MFLLQTHLSQGVQENMLKAWNFTKNKFHHRCLDINLQKIFRTNILENAIGQILVVVNLMNLMISYAQTIN